MNKKISLTLLSLSFLCLYFPTTAQDYVDFAQYFSQREISGTARMQGMGGISTSLGGDISSTVGNPAGLGFFNRSEFSFSPSLGFHNTTSTYLGTSTDDFKTNFNFGSLGVVLNNGRYNGENWRGGSFGISYTRINDFHSQVNYSGSNSDYDFPQSALEGTYYLGNSVEFDDIYSELAFETYLIDEFYDPNTDEYFIDTYNDRGVNPGFPVSQTELITTKGAGYSTNLAYGGNFSDKFYFGVSLAFTSMEYEIERSYTEVPNNTILNNLNLAEKRVVDGAGFNLSLGAIYRPITPLTIGLSYTTPSYYSVEEASTIDLTGNFNDSTNTYGFEHAYQFNLRTPAKINTGISYFIGKNGFITADIEYVNYEGNRYSSNEDDFSLVNDDIKSSFNSVINYKIGGEYRFNIFRARAGYAFFADPMDINDGIDRSRQSFSLGAGIKLKNYYVDLGVVNTRFESNYSPFIGATSAAVDHNFTRGIFTVGFNF